MRRITNQALSILVGLSALGCASTRQSQVNVNVTKASQMANATTGSVIYGLPVTAVKVEVEAEKIIKKTGPFYRYSEKYLNLSNVVTEDSEEWIIKNVKLVPYGKSDSSRVFAIQMQGNGVAQNISLTNNGILCGININKPCPCQEKATFEKVKELSLAEVNFDGVPMLEKQLVATSSATMAEETAKYIYKLRKRRSRIFTSDFANLPPDGKAYEISDDESEKLEKAFTELFAGKIVKQTIKQSFEIIPGGQGGENMVLFRFSSRNGFVDKMDLSGTPVYVEVKDITETELPEKISDKKDKKVSNGLFYQLPGKANIKVIDRNILLSEQEIEVAQFGQLLSLPAPIMGQPNLSIELSPVTGALLYISTEKK
jgi:hypothetical protein